MEQSQAVADREVQEPAGTLGQLAQQREPQPREDTGQVARGCHAAENPHVEEEVKPLRAAEIHVNGCLRGMPAAAQGRVCCAGDAQSFGESRLRRVRVDVQREESCPHAPAIASNGRPAIHPVFCEVEKDLVREVKQGRIAFAGAVARHELGDLVHGDDVVAKAGLCGRGEIDVAISPLLRCHERPSG